MVAAGDGFARYGYAGTGLGWIVTGAGLTKGALFHHFPDKRSLAKAWLDERLADEIEALWVRPLAEADSLTGLKRICRTRIADLEPGDATFTLAALAAELGRQDEILASALESIFDAWRDAVAGVFERGRAAGGVFGSVKPAAEAAMLVALVTGIAVQTAVVKDAALRQTCLTSVEDYLDTLRATA